MPAATRGKTPAEQAAKKAGVGPTSHPEMAVQTARLACHATLEEMGMAPLPAEAVPPDPESEAAL